MGPVLADATAPPPEAAWERPARISRIGLGVLIAGGAVRAVGGGLSLLALADEDLGPVARGTSAVGGTGVGLGAVGVAAGSLGAAGAVRRAGERCPAWAGVVALPAAAIGIGLAWVPVASGEPLPFPTSLALGAASLLPVPFAAAQAAQAEACARRAGWPELPEEHGLLELAVVAGPGGVTLVGRL